MAEGFSTSVYTPSTKSRLAYIPWLPIILGLVSIICTAVWYHYGTLALHDTKIIAALISIPPPRAFTSVLPSLMAASLAFVILISVAAWALYAFRGLLLSRAADARSSSSKQQLKPFVIATGITNALLYLVVVWFVVMFAISLLWAGGGMIAAKATMDGANTLVVVDETLPKLIKTAMGIDPAKQGYLVHVGGRDVNIGTSSCSLFCFTLARAMLADTIDCTCDPELAKQLMPAGHVTHDISDPSVCSSTPVMCSINAYAFSLYKQHMVPAVIGIVIALLCLIALLMLLSGTFARALSEQRGGSISRCSSADADMRVDADGSPRKSPTLV